MSLLAPLRRVRPEQARLHRVVDNLLAQSFRGAMGRTDPLSLLRAHDSQSDARQQLRDDVLTILLAGHDTIANALTWSWLLLATHREVEAEALPGRAVVV